MNIDLSRPDDFARYLNGMTEDKRQEFYELIKEIVSEEELKALRVMVSYYGLVNNPVKYRAMKKAMAESVYEELTK